MGFQDIARSSDVSRIFIKKYHKTAIGEDEEDNLRILMAEKEIDWEKEFAKIKGNLSENGIKWNETREPFITVEGTAQVSKCDQIKMPSARISRFCVFKSGLRNIVFTAPI